MAKEKQKKLINRLTHKYRLSIYNDDTFKEVLFIRLSRLNLLAITGTLMVLFLAAVFALVAYTSIREFIPGYPDGEMRRNIVMNALKLDSLENEIYLRDQYFENINRIISGEAPPVYDTTNIHDDTKAQVSFTRSTQDSLFRRQIEEEEQFNLTLLDFKERESSFSGLHFFPPLRGIITNRFNPDEGHFGIDIVAPPNEIVKAVLDGTIIMATWTLETGHVIQIQHEGSLISVYKHNSELLKRVGNHVNAGEVIAIVGNSGEYTTGPHLHFELWYNRTPINPEEYIVF